MKGPTLAAALLVTAACASAPAPRVDRSLLGPEWSTRYDLQEALFIEEQTSSDRTLPVSAGRKVSTVDFRSTLVVHFNSDTLRDIAGGLGTGEVDLPDVGTEELRARSVAERLLSRLQVHLAEAERVNARVPAVLAEGDQGEIEALEKEIAAAATARLPLLQAVEECVQNLARERGLSLEQDEEGEYLPDTRAFFEEVEDPLFPPGRLFDPRAVAELLGQQQEVLLRYLEDDMRAASEAGRMQLRVWAEIVGGSEGRAFVPVQNYSRSSQGNELQKPAVSLNLNAEQLAELERRFRAAEDFARFANDLRRRDSELRSRLTSLGEALLGDVSKLRGMLSDVEPWTAQSLDAVEGALTELGAGEQVAEIRRAVETAEGVADDLERLLTLAGSASTPGELLGDGGDAFVAVRGVAERLEALKQVGNGLPEKLSTLIGAMEAVGDALRTAVANAQEGEGREKVKELLRSLGLESEESFAALKKSLSSYEAVWAAIRTAVAALGNSADQQELADRLEVGKTDPNALLRGIDEAVPATIFLKRTPADRGDSLLLYVELVEAPQEGSGEAPEVKLAHVQELAVIRRGLYDTLDSHVIFADRRNEPGGTVTATNFEAAPSASWTLHYAKLERTDEADSWSGFWNTLDPGVGVNVSALNFEDDGVEVGVGLHVTFFSDLLQLGYGWNLNVDGDREFFFIGIGIVEMLNVAGLGSAP